MKLIYLHLYKDTYLKFMQAYKLLDIILYYCKKFEKRKNIYFPKLKVFTNSKIRVLIESRA